MTLRTIQLNTLFNDFHFNGHKIQESIKREDIVTVVLYDGSPYLVYIDEVDNDDEED